MAENSSKNINHSFTVLTPFQQEVVLAAPCRKEMEQWVSAFKLAASKSRNAVSFAGRNLLVELAMGMVCAS